MKIDKSYTYYFNLGFDNLVVIKLVAVHQNVFVAKLLVSVNKEDSWKRRNGKERKGKGS